MEEAGDGSPRDKKVVAGKTDLGWKMDGRRREGEAMKSRRKEGGEAEWDVVEEGPEEGEEWKIVGRGGEVEGSVKECVEFGWWKERTRKGIYF